MHNTPFDQPQQCLLRTTFLTKGKMIGAFFLHSGNVHLVCTFDPRLSPPLYYFQHPTREIAVERYLELIKISHHNGWKTAFDGLPNDSRLS